MIIRYSADLGTPNEQFWQQALSWAATTYDQVCFLHPSDASYPEGTFPTYLAAGSVAWYAGEYGQAFERLKSCKDEWLFGFLGYELKNEVENHQSHNLTTQGFPDFGFFEPRHILHISSGQLIIESVDNPQEIYDQILRYSWQSQHQSIPPFRAGMEKAEYLEKVDSIREHIRNGDVYELNLCQEYVSHAPNIDPLSLYWKLRESSPTPFAAYLKWEDQHLLCASPERFLKNEGGVLTSQPIKGTARRDTDPIQDQVLKRELGASEKERAENMMIVDLVRNDLAKSTLPGSVQVKELFGLYSFPQVHQMISTVTASLTPDLSPILAIKNAFPMGSMTGAPKVKAMELIEQYENARRGIFSGTVGFITPTGDFDLNVVIRSLIYNQTNGALSYQVGGAITYDSDPEQEYEECQVKSLGIQRACGQA